LKHKAACSATDPHSLQGNLAAATILEGFLIQRIMPWQILISRTLLPNWGVIWLLSKNGSFAFFLDQLNVDGLY
jgi:hypothetical protein